MPTYRTFKRSIRSWEEFARAPKQVEERGLTFEQASSQCGIFNKNRSKAQIQRGTKLEFERED
jgi:hypothetical protein